MRSLSPAVLAAVTGKTLTLALFAEIAFADNTLYLFSGVGTFAAPGPAYDPTSTFPYTQPFTGLGWLAKLSSIPQTTKIQAQNITLSLSGIPASLVAEATGQVRMSGTATIWLGFFDTSGNLLADPAQIFQGSLDVPSLNDGGDTSVISISCENSLISLNLAPNRRFDDPDQQIYHPGDLGMSFVDALENLQLFWPAPYSQNSPWQTHMTITPAGADVAVGGTQQLTLTVYFSNGTNVSGNAGVGNGLIHAASTDPKIATVDNNGLVTGVGVGVCNIIVRQLQLDNTTHFPFTQFRAACTVIVHS
jgi:hypothetical protein